MEELRRVIDPETELNIVDEGLVHGLTVEDKKAMVWLLLARTTPECHFCQAIAMNVQKRIIRDIITRLRDKGFTNIKVYNEIGLLLEEWRGEEEG
ncbi:iron-sulfur cluster assembly protein [Thermococcus aggregans]|uniref:iron-sulfur cluster assembly protein n=1 Tax=Thermococcus aggregans TaxID=110163 RepID=UPI00344EAF5D